MPYLPLKEKPFRNVESIGNTSGIDYFMDAVKTDYMDTRSRQFLSGPTNNYFCDLGTGSGVDGVSYSRREDVAFAISAGRLFKITESGTVTEITGTTLSSGIPVSMADFGDTVYLCNNSRIVEWPYSSASSSYISDADAPTDATHVAFLDSYLVALRRNSARFEWAEADNPDSWQGEFATAESRPDNAVALLGNFGELFIPGEDTSEHWTDSGDLAAPFQRIPGTITERGCSAPYSVAQVDNSYFFLDTERRVIRLAGRQPQVISNPYDAEFQALSAVSDAIGMHFNANGSTLYVITFPTAERTFFYDYKLDYWGEWSYWNGRSRDAWLGNCGVYIDTWNKYLVGSRLDGKIYLASYDYLSDGGQDQITEIWTGNINWGTDKRKECSRLRLKLKRGAVSVGSAEPVLRLSWRDDGKTTWSPEREVSLGISGDTEFVQTFRRLGVYRSRQWRFRINGAALTLVSAEEEVVPID
jgi:hypothetical protein